MSTKKKSWRNAELDRVADLMDEKIAYWMAPPQGDPHGIANAVLVTLRELQDVIHKSDYIVSPPAVALGRLGGKAGTGKAKARTSEQARAAVMARWKKKKLRKERESP